MRVGEGIQKKECSALRFEFVISKDEDIRKRSQQREARMKQILIPRPDRIFLHVTNPSACPVQRLC
jgi:hypothetical protein